VFGDFHLGNDQIVFFVEVSAEKVHDYVASKGQFDDYALHLIRNHRSAFMGHSAIFREGNVEGDQK